MEKYEHVLENGFKVILIPNCLRPMVEVSGWTRAGYACRSGNATIDSRGWPALLVPQMLKRGTRSLSADEFEDMLDNFALRYEAEHSYSSAFFVEWDGKAIRPYEKELLRLMCESLSCPTFPEDELFTLKKDEEAGFINALSDVEKCASREGLRMLYGPAHYLFPLAAEESVAQLSLVTRNYLVPFWEKFYTPDRSGIVVAGDINPDIALAQIEEIFGRWDKADPFCDMPDMNLSSKNFYGEEGYEQRTVFVPDKADAVVYVLKRMDISSSHPDYAALRIAVYILGENAHSRLFQNVRRKCGSYDTGAMFHQMHVLPGCLLVFAHNPPEKIDATQNEVMRVLADFYENGTNDTELCLEKTVYRNRVAQSRSSLSGVAQEYVINHIAGNPNYVEDLAARVALLSVDDVNEAIRKYLDPSDMKVVRAGTIS
jgi:zinc protease